MSPEYFCKKCSCFLPSPEEADTGICEDCAEIEDDFCLSLEDMAESNIQQ